MIDAIRNALRYGGDQAITASRGEGKTKIFERTLLKYTLAGVVNPETGWGPQWAQFHGESWAYEKGQDP